MEGEHSEQEEERDDDVENTRDEAAIQKINAMKDSEERRVRKILLEKSMEDMEDLGEEEFPAPERIGSFLKSIFAFGPSSGDTIAEGPGLENNTTWKVLRFAVYTKTMKGETWKHGGDYVSVKIMGPRPKIEKEEEPNKDSEDEADAEDRDSTHSEPHQDRGEFVDSSLVRLKVDIVDREDGTYSCSYFPTVEGYYHIHIQLNGADILDTPWIVYHRNPILELFGCRVDGSYVDDPMWFQVELQDKEVQLEDEHITIYVSGPDYELRNPDISWSEEKKGVLNVRFWPDMEGIWEIDVKAFGKSLAGCPYTCKIKKKKVSIEGIKKGDDLDLPAHLTRIRVGLGWKFPDKEKLDLDVSCIMLRYFIKFDHVFFNSLRSQDGSVVLSGDNRSGTSEESEKKKSEKERVKQKLKEDKKALKEKKREERRKKRSELTKGISAALIPGISKKKKSRKDGKKKEPEAQPATDEETKEDEFVEFVDPALQEEKTKGKKFKAWAGKAGKFLKKKGKELAVATAGPSVVGGHHHQTASSLPIGGSERSTKSSKSSARSSRLSKRESKRESKRDRSSKRKSSRLKENIDTAGSKPEDQNHEDDLATETDMDETDFDNSTDFTEMSDEETMTDGQFEDDKDALFAGKSQHELEKLTERDDEKIIQSRLKKDKDEEWITVNLPAISPKFNTLLFTVNVFNNDKTFEAVSSSYVRLVNDVTGKVLYKYNLIRCQKSGVIVCKLHRYGPSLWRLHIIDEPVDGHTFNAIPKAAVGKYLIKEPDARKIRITVLEAKSVPAVMLSGLIELYCVVLFDNKSGRTKTIRLVDDIDSNPKYYLNPPDLVWNETFTLTGQGNICEVMLWGITSSNKEKFMGRIYLEQGIHAGDGEPKWMKLQLHPHDAEDVINLGDIAIIYEDEEERQHYEQHYDESSERDFDEDNDDPHQYSGNEQGEEPHENGYNDDE